MKISCELCAYELKGEFTMVSCTYFEYHPLDECGGCEYPVGSSCVKKIDNSFRSYVETIEGYEKKMEEWRVQHG